MAANRVIPSHDYRRERWKNGLGWTREIARGPRSAGAWDWRLSIAEIESDAPFSAFPGVDRELVLLGGNGLRLRFGDGRIAELRPPHGRCRFAGEDVVRGELVDGRTTDFNLMWRRERYDAALHHRPLVGTMQLFVDPDELWALHLLAGHAVFADGSPLPPLQPGDTAILQAAGARERHPLEGSGELLLVRLQQRQA